jgi:glycosyltransferase involved in cell wall biosynthesis
LPRVSVVVAAFNAEEWLAESLATVLAQSLNDLEIIVVDDGSRDRTTDIAASVLSKGGRPYQIISQSNSGVSAARNRGWRMASAEWIQFLDADDLLHPEKIAIQVDSIATEPTADDVLYSDWEKWVFDNGNWRGEGQVRHPVIGADVLGDLLRDENFQQLGSQLVRKTALARVDGFDPKYSLVEDVELCIRLANTGSKFRKVPSPGPVFWYRDRPRSLSKLDQRQFVEACVRNARLVAQLSAKWETMPASTAAAIVDVYYGAARYFAAHDETRFEQLVTDIEQLSPGFVPEHPFRLRLLSQVAGYRRAERAAAAYRHAMAKGAAALAKALRTNVRQAS